MVVVWLKIRKHDIAVTELLESGFNPFLKNPLPDNNFDDTKTYTLEEAIAYVLKQKEKIVVFAFFLPLIKSVQKVIIFKKMTFLWFEGSDFESLR